MRTDGFADQGRRGGTMNIASLKLDHRISPDFVVFAAASNASAPACFQGKMTTTICRDRKTTKEKISGGWSRFLVHHRQSGMFLFSGLPQR
jgi:hypothetical protein